MPLAHPAGWNQGAASALLGVNATLGLGHLGFFLSKFHELRSNSFSPMHRA